MDAFKNINLTNNNNSIPRYVEDVKTNLTHIEDKKALLQYIMDTLTPRVIETKNFGDVFTQLKLVEEMLDTLPKEVWSNPKLKFLEPGSGLGNFTVCVYQRLMNGLKDEIIDSRKRARHIIENMLYMAELNSANAHICRGIFKVKQNGYKINLYEGDFLELDTKKVWGIDKFDIILGNPPYQKQVGTRKTQPLWNLFIKNGFNLLKHNGYLLFVNPSGWRAPYGTFRDVFDIIISREILFLAMRDFKAGSAFFNVGTNFDYYLVKNNKNTKNETKLIDINNKILSINLHGLPFIPSGKFDIFNMVLAKQEDTVNVLYSRSNYGTDKKYMSKTKTSIFKYPCIYTITTSDGINLFYSNRIEGHFGIPKVIWSNGLGTYPIVDKTGEYGLTQFSYAIVDKKETLQYIADALNTPEFIDLMTYVKFTNNKYNHKVIGLFKKDFYKFFLPDFKTPLTKGLTQTAGFSRPSSMDSNNKEQLMYILSNAHKINISYNNFEAKLLQLNVKQSSIPKLWNDYYINKI